MDSNQLRQLREAAENARKFNEMYGQQIRAMQQFKLNIPKIELSHLRKIQEDIRAFQKSVGYELSQIAEISRLYNSQFKEIQQTIAEFSKTTHHNLSHIRANAVLLSISLKQIASLPEFQESFAGEIAFALQKAIEVEPGGNQEAFEEFENFVEEIIKKQPDANSRLAVLNLIIAILALLTGTALGTGQFYYSRLQYFEAVEQRKVNEAKAIEDKSIYYAVKRKLELKVNPKFQSSTIAVLYPNQIVRLVKRQHKWIYVEYFDYLEGIPKNGWVNKKYLTKIEKGDLLAIHNIKLNNKLISDELKAEIEDWQSLGMESWEMFEYEEHVP